MKLCFVHLSWLLFIHFYTCITMNYYWCGCEYGFLTLTFFFLLFYKNKTVSVWQPPYGPTTFHSGGLKTWLYIKIPNHKISIYNKSQITISYHIDHAQICATETTNDGKLGLILNNTKKMFGHGKLSIIDLCILFAYWKITCRWIGGLFNLAAYGLEQKRLCIIVATTATTTAINKFSYTLFASSI